MATINMYMKFKIEIPKQTWLMLRKPCRLQTDGRTDRRTDGRTDKVNPVYPPSNFVGRGYNNDSKQVEDLMALISKFISQLMSAHSVIFVQIMELMTLVSKLCLQ